MKQHIALVGLGVIGGTFAKAIHKHAPDAYTVSAIDTNEEALKAALDDGVIAYGETKNRTILQNADLVIISLYPKALKTFLETHHQDFKPGAIVTETSGIKQSVIAFIAPHIPPDIDFIYGHPMAGREKQGYAYSDASVFNNANYLISPTEENNRENINWFTAFLKTLGFKRISEVTPPAHDALIGYTSQLTHAIAVALMNSDDSARDTYKYVGDSFRDLTRIANINEYLWSELFLENKEALLASFDTFEHELRRLKTAIETDNIQDMQDIFRQSSQRRLVFESADESRKG